MFELDNSRDGTDHSLEHLKPVTPIETDDFCRQQLGPLLGRLNGDQRSRFDKQLLADFAPQVDSFSSFAAQMVLHRLDIEQLHETATAIQAILDKQPS